MRYKSPGALRAALEARFLDQARSEAVSLDRLRRRAVFERILVRLERAQAGKWVLKGGMALELRWLDRARATRDLDLVSRELSSDGSGVRDDLVEALSQDPDGDWFEFRVGQPIRLEADEAGRPGWRFSIGANLDGRPFANVRLDVVARIEEITATERLPLPGVLSFADLPLVEVEVIEPRQHFAEKLHALTRTYGDRPSSRVKDLPDMVLLIEDGLEPSADLAAVVSHVFSQRATHPVPTELSDPPADWRDRYAELAGELDVQPKTLEEAMTLLRAFWERTQSARTEETANAES